MKRNQAMFLWAILLFYLVASYVLVKGDAKSRKVSGLEVRTIADTEKSLLSPVELSLKVRQYYPKIDSMLLDEVKADELEIYLSNQAGIKRVDVYKTYSGKIKVDVEQRKPILRIMKSGRNAYLDESGMLIPFSRNYTAHVPVATGYIPFPDDFLEVENYPPIINHLYELVQFLRENPMWDAQIEQIYVDKKQEITLIPRIGNHKIILGEPEDYSLKFKKLNALYKQAFIHTGWNNYRIINLKYKNQVVCTKI